jgi:hypothetical protein
MDIYDEYKRRLLDEGLSEGDADAVVADARALDEKLARRECPSCGAPLTVTRDPRQDGYSEFAGVWFNYRCTARCGWLADSKEPIGQN